MAPWLRFTVEQRGIRAGRYSLTHLVCKNHESIVGFAPDGSAHTLGRVSHGVEGQEVVLSDLKVIPEILQTRLFGREAAWTDAR